MEGFFFLTFSCRTHVFGFCWKEKAFWAFRQVFPNFICQFDLWNVTFEPKHTFAYLCSIPIIPVVANIHVQTILRKQENCCCFQSFPSWQNNFFWRMKVNATFCEIFLSKKKTEQKVFLLNSKLTEEENKGFWNFSYCSVRALKRQKMKRKKFHYC